MFDTFKDKKKYCVYFKYMSMLALFLLITSIISMAYIGKLDMKAVYITGVLLMSYFQSRLLYTMCVD
jgi:hypothetical protein